MSDPAYTLQHEQIHFAIREIEVRRLNQSAEGVVSSDRRRRVEESVAGKRFRNAQVFLEIATFERE